LKGNNSWARGGLIISTGVEDPCTNLVEAELVTSKPLTAFELRVLLTSIS
jgi:hypothetical protein